MKKILLSLTVIISAFLFTACANNTEVKKSAEEIAASLAMNVEFSETMNDLSQRVLLRKYGLDETMVTEAAGYSGTKAVVDEIAVFKTDNLDKVLENVDLHIESQKTNYSSYAPNEMPKLEASVIHTAGNCVIVCVSNEDTASVMDKINIAVE